jgi:mRNA-degrading endonuclease RelE of RelBE toxin-antitoxin system
MFATLFFGILDPRDGKLTYINGGHEPPLIIQSGLVRETLHKTSPRFKKAFKKLPPELQAKVIKALKLLEENPRHPSLQIKPVHGVRGIFEARVDQPYRMTYQRLPDDVLFIRVVGKHDETLKNP